MTNSVDSRVVQMVFDNANFEKGVANTLQSLDALDKSLNSKEGAKGFAEAMGSVNFDSIESNLNSLKQTATSVFSEIISEATKLSNILKVSALGTVGAAVAQMAIGGTRRAENIENAKFQLSGLGVAWEQVSDSLDWAVKDTAFGMDEAARAAAQFVASGVELGDQMSYSLRAISGVAAMTNSSYSEIAQTFTKVAGNGRLMGIDLLSLSTKGLNAAAALGKQLNKTEAEIRDMVSKGQIDFDTFAKAMDDAFGDHAKKANDTFNGAFANMKAALSRIGADFISPVREMERQIFLGVKNIINQVRSGLNQTTAIYRANGEYAGEWSIVSSFKHNVERIGQYMQIFMDTFARSDVISDAVSVFTSTVDSIFHGVMVNSLAIAGPIFKQLSRLDLKPFANSFNIFSEALFHFSDFTAKHIETGLTAVMKFFRGILEIGGKIASIFVPSLADGVKSFYSFVEWIESGADVVLGLFDKLATGFLTFAHDFKVPEDVKNSFQAFASAINNVIDAIGRIASSVASGVLALFSNISFDPNGADLLLGFLGGIASISSDALNLIADGLQHIADSLASLLENTPDLGLSNLFGTLFDSLKNGAQAIGTFFKDSGILDGIKEFFSNISIENIGQSFINVWNMVSSVFASLGSFFSTHIESAGGFFSGILEGIKEIGAAIANGAWDQLLAIFTGVTNAAETAGDVVSEATSPFKEFVDSVKSFIEGISFDHILVGLSGVATGFALFKGYGLIKDIDGLVKTVKKLGDGFVFIAEFPAKVGQKVLDTFDGIMATMKATQQNLKAEAILKIAAAIALLAASLWLIAQVPEDKLIASLGVLTVMIGVVVGAFAAMTKLMDKMVTGKSILQLAAASAMFASMSATITSFAIAIGVLTAAIIVLGSLPLPTIIQGGIAVIAMLLGLAFAIRIAGAAEGQLVKIGVSLIGIAAALLILALAIQKFGSMDPMVLAQGLNVTVGLLVVLFALSEAAEKSETKFTKLAASFILLAAGMTVLATAIAIFGHMKLETLAKGIGSVAVILGVLGLYSKIVSKESKQFGKIAASLILLSIGLAALSGSLILLSNFADEDGLLRAVGALAIMMLLLSAFTTGISSLKTDKLAVTLAAISLLSASMLLLAGALAILANVPAEGLGYAVLALVALVGVLTVLSVAAAAAGPAILYLGAAITLIGAGIALAGFGLVAFASGCVMLAAVAPSAFFTIGEAFKILLDKVNEGIPLLVQCFTTLLESLAQASESWRSSLLAIARNILTFLVEGFVQSASILLEGFLKVIKVIMDNADALANGLTLFGVKILLAIASAIRGNADIIYGTFQTIILTLGGIVLDGIAMIADALGLHGWADQMRVAADDMYAEADRMTANIAGIIEERYPEMADTVTSSMEKMASAHEVALDRRIKADEAALKDTERVWKESWAQGDIDPLVQQAQEEVLASHRRGLEQMKTQAGELSTEAGEATVKGLEESTEPLSETMDSEMGEVSNSISAWDGYSKAFGAFSNVGNGALDALDEYMPKVKAKAAEMGNISIEGINSKEGTDSNSPSKKAYQSGTYVGMGMVLGMDSMIGQVADSAASMGSAAIGKLSPLGSMLGDYLIGIDLDTQPTIRPVLDLTDVERGAGYLNGLFLGNNVIGASWADRRVPVAVGASSGDSYRAYGDVYLQMEYTGQTPNEFVNDLSTLLATRHRMEG